MGAPWEKSHYTSHSLAVGRLLHRLENLTLFLEAKQKAGYPKLCQHIYELLELWKVLTKIGLKIE